MLSDYFTCLFGYLLLNEAETAEVNRKRATKGRPPIRFGTLSPPEGHSVKLGEWDGEEVKRELERLNAERLAAGLPPILPSWSSSTCKLDYGKNRDQYWRCPHIALHLEQYYDIFEMKCPECDPIVVKDNSSGHGAYATDALLSQRMSVGWGGKQPLMKQTVWYDDKGKKHIQDMVFTGEKGEKKISAYSGRKKNKKDPDPSHIGQAKGLHQVLWERGLVPERSFDPVPQVGPHISRRPHNLPPRSGRENGCYDSECG
jgi:hypothetical protein